MCPSKLQIDRSFLLNYAPLARLIDYANDTFMSILINHYRSKTLEYDKMTWFLDCLISICKVYESSYDGFEWYRANQLHLANWQQHCAMVKYNGKLFAKNSSHFEGSSSMNKHSF